MENSKLPTAEQIMSFDDKFYLSVPVEGYTSLSLNASGTTEWGDVDGLQQRELSRCYLHYEDDQKIEFSNVYNPDTLLVELVKALHDKEVHQVVETLKGEDFPYRVASENDIHWPC